MARKRVIAAWELDSATREAMRALEQAAGYDWPDGWIPASLLLARIRVFAPHVNSRSLTGALSALGIVRRERDRCISRRSLRRAHNSGRIADALKPLPAVPPLELVELNLDLTETEVNTS